MINIGVILGSASPGRVGEAVADWVLELAKQRKDAYFELIDIKDLEQPKKWAQTISRLDGFIFVTPEYDHSSAVLKNALDYLYNEWHNKVAGFVGYGVSGGSSTVEQLRAIMAKLQITDVRAQVLLKITNDIAEHDKFIPASPHKLILYEMIDQIIYWGDAMKKVRAKSEVA